eukprot:TRINITY_DN2092_c0_g2_i2.p1 TRINITY_DN2092_c0_g2~~TRINITY_DN2092_c0_g2_i2.p1  ORF type:complete len:203 (+),score=42.44 TRINITY_DN2092_c0_g2_i2:111-719(+)
METAKKERKKRAKKGAAVIENAANYVEKQQIFELFEGLVQDLVISQPADPIAHLIRALGARPVLRIVAVGGPASGKGTQCARVVKEFGVVHVSTGDLLRAEVAAGTPLGSQIKAAMADGALLGDDIVSSLVLTRLQAADCVERGWLLDGFPRTPRQAEFLLEAGHVASKVIVLEVPDAVMAARVGGRRLDPDTGKVYHLEHS